MLVGYIRVSTDKQNLDRQESILKEKNVDKVFKEKLSGKDANRTELKLMLDFVRDGDVVIVESYSRLARSASDLLNIVEKLKKKNVGFISVKENFDTSNPQGKFILTVFSGLAELERECMLQRQREGIQIAKEKGKYKGRKPIALDEQKFDTIYKEWKSGAITAVKAMDKLSLSKNTFYRRVKDYENSLKNMSNSSQI